MLEIRKTLAVNEWLLNWNARTTNMFADALAKKALASSYILSFCSLNLSSIPIDLENVIIFDMAGINSSL